MWKLQVSFGQHCLLLSYTVLLFALLSPGKHNGDKTYIVNENDIDGVALREYLHLTFLSKRCNRYVLYAGAETTREAIQRLKAEHYSGTNPHEHEPRNRKRKEAVYKEETEEKRDETASLQNQSQQSQEQCESEAQEPVEIENGVQKEITLENITQAEIVSQPPAVEEEAPPQEKSKPKSKSSKNKSSLFELDIVTGVNQKMITLDSSLLQDDQTLIDALPKDIEEARASVRDATKRAWNAYKASSWGSDELVPRGCSFENSFSKQGITILDSMSTLLTMKLDDEFQEALAWVRDEMDFEKMGRSLVSTFETIIRSLGGLLSAYELSGDCAILEKATALGTRILDTFDDESLLMSDKMRLNGPYPFKGNGKDGAMPKKSHAPVKSLAEAGTFSVEFLSLSYNSGDKSFKHQADVSMERIIDSKMSNGLYPLIFKSGDVSSVMNISSVGAKGDSFYEYLLKRWIHSDKDRNVEGELQSHHSYLLRWVDSVDSIIEHMVTTSEDGYMYVGDYNDGEIMPRMEHLSCFFPGMLALGVDMVSQVYDIDIMDAEKRNKYMDIAERIAKTCYAMYATSGSKGVSPEFVYFSPNMSIGEHGRAYLLRPEAIESFYYLYKITRKPIYRAYGLDIFKNLLKSSEREGEENGERHCGFSIVEDVTDRNITLKSTNSHAMPSYFIAETLKYLYLLFSKSDVYPFDDYVFNTEGHPLRVKQSYFANEKVLEKCKLESR